MSRENKAFRPPGGGPRHGGMPMGRPVEKAKDFKGTSLKLLHYLKPFWKRIAVVFLMAVLSTLFNILSPVLMGKATTKIFEGFMAKFNGVEGAAIDFAYVKNIILILAGLYFFSSVFNFLQQYIMVGIAQKTVFNLREELNIKINKLPLKYLDSQAHGEILSRVANDVDTVSNTLQQSLTQLITAIVTLTGIIIMMLSISPLLTLIVSVTLPLSLLVTVKIAKRSQNYFAQQQKALGELNGHIEEMYTGHEIVKGFGYEQQSISIFREVNDRLYTAGWKAQFVAGIIMPLLSFINNIGYVLVCVAGGIMVAQKSIEIGNVQAFIQYARQFNQPIIQTANIANILQSTVAAAERVFEILEETEEIPDPADAKEINVPEVIRFDKVSFGYNPENILLKDINIQATKGQAVAIVGHTGAGKTTLVNLLMRFYEVNSGVITIDGVDITKVRKDKLRSLFGMVLQDTWLFHGTIKENIAYGKPEAKEEEIIRAAKAAYADHFIRTLPEGYDTVLNEEASNLSQGQKQLLTIARAILANPAILILDEATSSVDSRTEILLQKAMKELREGRTSFIIAHRLSTIRNADLILVMDRGAIVEQGTHEKLLAKRGFYAGLYYSQFSLA